MNEKVIRKSVLYRYYLEACRPFNVMKWGGFIFVSLFLGVVCGTLAYG